MNKNKSPLQPSLSSARTYTSPLKNSEVTFYKNAIRMGQIKSLKPIGTSIVLYHNNLNGIVSQNSHSEYHGHCIFYKNRCIISVEYTRNRIVDIVYRIDGYLLFLRYNEQYKLEGLCFLFSFQDRKVYGFEYENDKLKEKRVMKKIKEQDVEDLFISNKFHAVIGLKHGKAINHEEISTENIRTIKKGNKVEVFYSRNRNAQLISGLGFHFIFRDARHGGYDPDTDMFGDEFELSFVEKGLYKNNLLHGYGHKVFKNSNSYEGYFQGNQFQGEGVLQQNGNGKWVYGIFEKGQLKDMLDFSNNSLQDQSKSQVLLEKMRAKEKKFMNYILDYPDFNFLDRKLEAMLSTQTQHMTQNFNDKKQEFLHQIAQTFLLTPKQLSQTHQIETRQLDINKKEKVGAGVEGKRSMKINSLVPQNIDFHQFARRVEQVSRSERQEQNNEVVRRESSISAKSNTKRLLSRIFNKDYSQFENNLSPTKGLNANTSLFKLHEVTNQEGPSQETSPRLRKSAIFMGRAHTARVLTQNVLSPFSRRSPIRKTIIFETNVKLKQGRNEDYSDVDKATSIRKLESIRKGSVEKKVLLPQSSFKKNKKNSIFQKRNEKEKGEGNFNYL